MAIEEITLLNMTFNHEHLDQILFQLKSIKDFYPQDASKIVNNVKGVQTFQQDDVYTRLQDRIIQIASDMKLELNKDFANDSSLNLSQVDMYLSRIEEEVKQIKNVQDELKKEKEENDVTLELLEKISLSGVDLDHLSQCHYVKARFGRFPKENLEKMKYYEGRPFIFYKLNEDSQYVWCYYIVTTGLLLEVDNIFQALGFEEIVIPSFVHGKMENAKKELETESQAMQEYILRMEQKIVVLKETHKVDLLKLYATVTFFKKIEKYKVYVVDYQSKCAIYGFIPTRQIENFKQNFAMIPSVEYQLLPNDILDHKEVIAPVIMHNSPFIAPFEIISQMKQSDFIDTTSAYACLYELVCLFYFGDLGVGGLFLLLGLWKYAKKIGKLFLALGIALCIGGLIYGKAFYTIQLYPAFISPMIPTIRIIDGLVLLGVGTYTIQSFKKIYTLYAINQNEKMKKSIIQLVIGYGVIVFLSFLLPDYLTISFIPTMICLITLLGSLLRASIKDIGIEKGE